MKEQFKYFVEFLLIIIAACALVILFALTNICVHLIEANLK